MYVIAVRNMWEGGKLAFASRSFPLDAVLKSGWDLEQMTIPRWSQPNGVAGSGTLESWIYGRVVIFVRYCNVCGPFSLYL